MNKPITIIIPNYNGAQILTQNLPSIIQHSQPYNAGIIIVDDASKDNSIEILTQTFPISLHDQDSVTPSDIQTDHAQGKISLIKKNINQGFSSTVNLGVKLASTELVCLFNSDVITSENFLDPIFPHFDQLLTAAVGLHDLSDDGDSHGRGKFIFYRGFLLHQKLINPMSTQIESGTSGWASCGSGVFSKSIWDQMGGLDENLNPFYFEDVDYGYRCWKAGYKIYFEQQSVVKHLHNKGAIKSNYDQMRIKTINYRNQLIFSWKNITDLDLLFLHLVYLPINFIIFAKNQDWAFFKGYVEAVKKLPSIITKRRELSKQKKLSDWELMHTVLSS